MLYYNVNTRGYIMCYLILLIKCMIFVLKILILPRVKFNSTGALDCGANRSVLKTKNLS